LKFGYQYDGVRIRSYDYSGTVPIYDIGIDSSLQQHNLMGFANLPGVSASDLNNGNNLLASLGGLLNDDYALYNVTSRTSGFVPGAPWVRNYQYDNHALYAEGMRGKKVMDIGSGFGVDSITFAQHGARLTFVGLGCPRQEVWAYENRPLLPMPLIAVGAAFDFHAGGLRQAPASLQRAGLEWLFRLVMEPRRLWRRYLFLNPYYLILLGLQAAGLRRVSPSDGSASPEPMFYA